MATIVMPIAVVVTLLTMALPAVVVLVVALLPAVVPTVIMMFLVPVASSVTVPAILYIAVLRLDRRLAVLEALAECLQLGLHLLHFEQEIIHRDRLALSSRTGLKDREDFRVCERALINRNFIQQAVELLL